MLELRPGQHVTNCLHCLVTCHEYCDFSDDNEKNTSRCLAMDKEGNCRICPNKCVLTYHKNTPYVFKYVTKKVTKTYSDMKKSSEAIETKKKTRKKIKDLEYCIKNMVKETESMMNEIKRCNTRLKEIELRSSPLTPVEHIDRAFQYEEK